MRNLTFGVPIRSREATEVLSGVAKIYAKVRAMQLPVTRVHTDRAREFSGGKFQRWALDRDLHHTMCSGDAPQENARAEKEVGIVKAQMRKMILASKSPLSFWPLAFRQATEQRHRAQLKQLGVLLPELLPFGAAAVVRRKEWHHRADPFRWPMMKVRLWGPAGDMAASSQGYFVQAEDGRFLRSTVVQIPSKVAEQVDVGQLPEEQAPEEREPHDGPQLPQPGRLPGGEEEAREEVREEVEKNENGQNGDVLDLGELGKEEEQKKEKGQSAEDEKLLRELSELAKGAQSTMEGLAQMSSGAFLQEEDKRSVFELIPHDAPLKRCRTKTSTRQVNSQPMVFKVDAGEGRSASNNWDGDSYPVADQPSGGNSEWEHIMLRQHTNLRSWTNEVAGMVNCGVASPEELQSVKDARTEITVLENLLDEIAVRSVQEIKTDQVLQTQMVSMDVVRRNKEEWRQAFAEEVEALMSTALEPIDEERFNQLLAGPMEVECLPMKGVASVKPPCRRKARIVVCGNYASEKEDEGLDNSASGVDSVCIRTFLNAAVQYDWTAGSIDVSKAFLQAPRRTATKRITIGVPPKIVTEMELITKGQRWIIHQALYGLTESPGDWGAHRDGELAVIRWLSNGQWHKLVKTPERNVWQITVENDSGEVGDPLGFLLVYVDDMLILGSDQLVKSTAGAIGKRWQCSQPEFLQEHSPMRFCGFELTKEKNGIRLDQMGYTHELLKKYGITQTENCPLPKVSDDEDTVEEPYSAEDLRRAQSIVGEMLWLSTRTRPDLAFGVGLLGRLVHKRPKTVTRLGFHMLKYVRATSKWGLVYEKCCDADLGDDGELQQVRTPNRVQVYADISFAPAREAYRSIQGIGIQHGKNLIAWESGRQPFVCASTAESELISYCEAFQVTESVTGLIEMAGFDVDRQLYGDNKAALAAITNESGNWRTRHLRLRAFALREALASPSRKWVARHLVGTLLLADGFTKPLLGASFESHRKKLGMKPRQEFEGPQSDEVDRQALKNGAMLALLLGSVCMWKSDKPILAALMGAVAGVGLATGWNCKKAGSLDRSDPTLRACRFGDSRALHSSSRPGEGHGFWEHGSDRAFHSSSRPGVCHHSWECGDNRAGQDGECQGEEINGQPKIRAFRIPGSGSKSHETEDGGEDQEAGLSYRRGGAQRRGRDAMSSTLTESFASLSITTNVTVQATSQPGDGEPILKEKTKKEVKKKETAGYVESKDSEFEPWRLQQFLQPPRGEDKWDISFLSEGWLIRTHGSRGRARPFHPIHRSCPVVGDRLTGDRVTALFNHEGGEWLYDKWTDQRTWQRAGPWKGFTFLKVKIPECASTGAASSGGREGEAVEEETGSISDGSYTVVSGENT